ncbi:MAG TPA: histidine phosphatase family protein [Candidatus Saccharimonadales bacterium]|nr:histidine phosphatase family protein [Candidatus Saccharimonadales bacterium]
MRVAFRHGLFPLIERTNLTGEAAVQAMREPIPPDADSVMDLLPPGREQAIRLRPVLAELAISACLRSPALRTKTTAEIAFAGSEVFNTIQIVPELRERSRGIFAYVPDVWAWTRPDYPIDKSFLDWQPTGSDYNGHPGESIRQVRDTRIEPVLQIADEIAPGKTVAFSTHAQWMSSLRAYYLKFDDERFSQPLVPHPPRNHPAFATAKLIVNGQIDAYDCTCSQFEKAETPLDHADVFRTIVTEPGLEFDSGWLSVREMQ